MANLIAAADSMPLAWPCVKPNLRKLHDTACDHVTTWPHILLTPQNRYQRQEAQALASLPSTPLKSLQTASAPAHLPCAGTDSRKVQMCATCPSMTPSRCCSRLLSRSSLGIWPGSAPSGSKFCSRSCCPSLVSLQGSMHHVVRQTHSNLEVKAGVQLQAVAW